MIVFPPQLLVVDENTRLGSQGPGSIKTHPWFDNVDWQSIVDSKFPVPNEILSRISQHQETHIEDSAVPLQNDLDEVNDSKWLDDW